MLAGNRIMFQRKLILVTVFALSAIFIGTLSVRLPAASDNRVAILVSSDQLPFKEALAGICEVLDTDGVAGNYDIYRLHEHPDKAAQIVRKIEKTPVRLIITIGSLASEKILEKISDLPVVCCLVLRSDYLRKSTNATGVFLEFPLQVQFKWMRVFLPEARNIGVLYNPGENMKRVEAAEVVAQEMGLTLHAQAVRTPSELPIALSHLSREVDVLWGLADRIVLTPETAESVLLFSFRNRIPFVGLSQTWTKAGALYSLDWDYEDLGKQCGTMALLVWKGKPVHDMAPVSPRKVRWSLNLKTAQYMKVNIPRDLVDEANFIF